MTNDASSPPADENTGASKKLIGSAVVVAAIVVLGLVLSLTNIFGGETEPTANPSAPSPSTATATATQTAQNEASVCGLEAVELSGTVTTAPTATWALVGTTAAPSIEGQGPGKIDGDGFRSCYARTPTGALVAAANYAAIGSYAPLRARFYDEATVPGPGRDALLKKPITGGGEGGTRVQIAGFRILRYDTRGHGQSELPPGPSSVAELGSDVIALMDALEDHDDVQQVYANAEFSEEVMQAIGQS